MPSRESMHPHTLKPSAWFASPRVLFALLCCGWMGVVGASLIGCQDDEFNELLGAGAIGPPGGSLRASNGAVLQIPTNSLNAVYRFDVLEVEQAAPDQHVAVSSIVDVKPANVSFSEALPASLILPLLRERIPGNRSLWNVRAFAFVSGQWQPVVSVIDDANSTISIPITKTGVYAAFLGPASPLEPFPEFPSPEPPKEPIAENPLDGPDSTSFEKTPDTQTEPKGEPSQETPQEKTPEPPPETTDAGTKESPPESTQEKSTESTIEGPTDGGSKDSPE